MLYGVLAAAALAMCGSAVSAQPWQELIDYTKLKSRVGGAVPTGSGGIISLVEGTTGGAAARSYPNLSGVEFTADADPTLPDGVAVSLTDGSGVAGNGFSNHATGISTQFFGNYSSTAPGANVVVHYEAGNWLTSQLHYTTNAEPELPLFRVQNHSWVFSSTNVNEDLSALRRLDWQIENSDMTAVVGANNAASLSQSAHPRLLIHAYNAIGVGRSDGYHSRGTTSTYGAGRFKPDIVATHDTLISSSRSTAMVSSAAAMLHEVVAGTDAAKSETLKAMLLAGATKQEFAGFIDTMPQSGGGPLRNVLNPWDRTPTRPLDDILGAGELNVYNSYLIQLGGQYAGSQAAPTVAAGSYGWDYQDHKNDSAVGDIYYSFEIADGSTAEELSIILAWNTKVTDLNSEPGTFTPDTDDSVQDLNLELFDSSGAFLGNLLDQSISTVDNVEHIYQTNLGAGTYTLKVSGAAEWDYGLAWRMTTKFDEISADFNEDGVVDGTDFLTWQRNVGTLLGAAHSEGDADGDGDVDGDDLTHVQNRVLPSPPMLAASRSAAAIPEPTTLALAAGALLAAAGWSLRRSRRG